MIENPVMISESRLLVLLNMEKLALTAERVNLNELKVHNPEKDEIDAAGAYVDGIVTQADRMEDNAPMWYGWAVREAFIAGVAWRHDNGTELKNDGLSKLVMNMPYGYALCHESDDVWSVSIEGRDVSDGLSMTPENALLRAGITCE